MNEVDDMLSTSTKALGLKSLELPEIAFGIIVSSDDVIPTVGAMTYLLDESRHLSIKISSLLDEKVLFIESSVPIAFLGIDVHRKLRRFSEGYKQRIRVHARIQNTLD